VLATVAGDEHRTSGAYEAGEQDGSLFIAMRFIDGHDLATEVREHGPWRPTASRGRRPVGDDF
jgi:hypothetical protein